MNINLNDHNFVLTLYQNFQGRIMWILPYYQYAIDLFNLDLNQELKLFIRFAKY